MPDESTLLDILAEIFAVNVPEGDLYIGDDCAVVGSMDGKVVVSCDHFIEGVHFDRSFASDFEVGFKSSVTAISDIAAMGCLPRFLLIGLATPTGTGLEEVFRGIKSAADHYGVVVVGGDMSSTGPSSQVLSISTTVIGTDQLTPAYLTGFGGDQVPEPVTRSGARPGDWIFVTGTLGGSCAGLRALRDHARLGEPTALERKYLYPVARIAQGVLARLCGARAMIDISDGFSCDLNKVCARSQVGFELSNVPCEPGASLEDALGGGGDYELVFTAPYRDLIELAFADKGLDLYCVGRCIDSPGGRFTDGTPVVPRGHSHKF